jgi:hypothetical protein
MTARCAARVLPSPAMNTALLVAAALIFLLGLVHSLLGERYILIRLFRRSDLPRLFGSDLFTRRTLRFAWHLTTVVWFGIGAMLVHVVMGGPLSTPEVGGIVAVTSAASALVSLVGSRGRHPAWVVFLAVAALVWVGTR